MTLVECAEPSLKIDYDVKEWGTEATKSKEWRCQVPIDRLRHPAEQGG